MKNNDPALNAEKDIALIDENLLKSRIYTIRGVKVMLDADLAEIYGYETRFFNLQVKRNLEKFDDDFRFQLTIAEFKSLMLKNATSKNGRGGARKPPYAFTEQGIYMLMTVLKGDVATRQSKALVRLFKGMKDYIVAENRQLLSCSNCVQVAALTAQHSHEIAEMQSDVALIKVKQDRDHEALEKMMENFSDPSAYKHFLILNGQKLEADVAYTQIYAMAKKSIVIIDDYVGVKTLDLLRCVAHGMFVLIYSDEKRPESLTASIRRDFETARPDVQLSVRPKNNKFHDRYIFLDYGERTEKLFHCGASCKDAGGKITTIMQIECPQVYHAMMEGMS